MYAVHTEPESQLESSSRIESNKALLLAFGTFFSYSFFSGKFCGDRKKSSWANKQIYKYTTHAECSIKNI